MGNKVIQSVLIFFLVIAWFLVIAIFLLSGIEGEIGRLVRVYCVGYGYYPTGVVLMRILSMFSTPIIITIILILLLSQMRKVIVLISFFLFVLSLFSFLSSVRSLIFTQDVVNLRLPDIKFIDINGDMVESKEYILTFFYIGCHGSCPLIVKKIKGVKDKTVILVSLNPYNTPEELREFYFKNGLGDRVKIVRFEKDELSGLLKALNLNLEIPNDKDAQINHPVVFYKVKENAVVKISYGLEIP